MGHYFSVLLTHTDEYRRIWSDLRQQQSCTDTANNYQSKRKRSKVNNGEPSKENGSRMIERMEKEQRLLFLAMLFLFAHPLVYLTSHLRMLRPRSALSGYSKLLLLLEYGFECEGIRGIQDGVKADKHHCYTGTAPAIPPALHSIR